MLFFDDSGELQALENECANNSECNFVAFTSAEYSNTGAAYGNLYKTCDQRNGNSGIDIYKISRLAGN